MFKQDISPVLLSGACCFPCPINERHVVSSFVFGPSSVTAGYCGLG